MQDAIHDIANYLHLLAALALLVKIWCTQSCAGLSGKAQFLYALVYTTRYVDLFIVYISKINSVIKIMYLMLGYCTILSIFLFFRKTYERKYDTFRIELLLIPCLVIALLVNNDMATIEVMWAFSIYLEAVAIIPQFHFLAKAKRIHKYVLCYITALGIYKLLYIAHWIYYYEMYDRFDRYTAASGIIQCVLYCDFFIRVLPRLSRHSDQEQEQIVATVDITDLAGTENGNTQKTGHMNCNISTIVLTPASLLTVSNDKESLLKAEEASAKSDFVNK